MKKIYISPISKVHQLQMRDGVLDTTSVTGGIKIGGGSEEDPVTPGSEKDGQILGRSNNGSTNIWDNEW